MRVRERDKRMKIIKRKEGSKRQEEKWGKYERGSI